jgi:hypothetical protein
MNQQPFAVPPQWWKPNLSPFWVRFMRRHRLRKINREQKITGITVEGAEHLRKALDSGAGVVITPNHSFHYDSYAMFEAAAEVNRPFYFLAAWQVFAMSSRWERWVLQAHGVFSIDREGTDLRAFKTAVDIIKTSPHPLVVFPEGDIYHTNDRLTPFRDGAAAMAISAAKRADRPIVLVPAALKLWYCEDPTASLMKVLETLEGRFNWRPRPDLSLKDRVYRVADGILTLKELEYLNAPQAGPLSGRLRQLTETLLSKMEQRSGIKSKGGIVPERVKDVRRHHIQALQKSELPAEERAQLLLEMDDLFFIVQLFSYPGDYAHTQPSIERLAETIDKFEEDVLGLAYPSIKGKRRIVVRFGEPIAAQPYVSQADGLHALTQVLETQVQALLDSLNAAKSPSAS